MAIFPQQPELGPFNGLPIGGIPEPLRPDPTLPVIGGENDIPLGGDGMANDYGSFDSTDAIGVDDTLVVEADAPGAEILQPVTAALGDGDTPDAALTPEFSEAPVAPDAPRSDIAEVVEHGTAVVLGGSERPQAVDLDGSDRPRAVDSFLGLDPSIRQRTHAFLAAEEVHPTDIGSYYDHLKTRNLVWKAWRDTEVAMTNADTRSLEHVKGLVDAAYDRYAPLTAAEDMAELAALEPAPDAGETPAETTEAAETTETVPETPPLEAPPRPNPELFFDAAILDVSLPAVADRIEFGEVRQATAAGVYEGIAEDILPIVPSQGDAAEALVYALGARNVMFDGDLGDYLHPVSPREGENTLKNDERQLYNCDFYELRGGAKTPIELKLRGGGTDQPSDYAPDIIYVTFFEDVGAAALGVDATNMTRAQRGALLPAAIGMMSDLMRDEVRNGVRHEELDAAYLSFRAVVDAQRNRQTDPRLRSERLRERLI
jgi:hypothetical protein